MCCSMNYPVHMQPCNDTQFGVLRSLGAGLFPHRVDVVMAQKGNSSGGTQHVGKNSRRRLTSFVRLMEEEEQRMVRVGRRKELYGWIRSGHLLSLLCDVAFEGVGTACLLQIDQSQLLQVRGNNDQSKLGVLKVRDQRSGYSRVNSKHLHTTRLRV